MAIWLASQLGDSLHSVDALVVGSPNFGPADERSEIFLLPFGLGTFIVKNFIANHYGFTPVNSSHSYYWTTYYPVEGIREVMKAVRAVREIELENLSTPLLMLYTRHDQVLSLDKMLQGFARIGSPVKILYEVKGSVDHGLAGDILSPESNREVIDVIELFVRGL
jgi:hypothetical protein